MRSLFLLLFAATAAAAQDRVLTAMRVTTPPRIDGHLDEAAWSRAQPATDFVQAVPASGAPATERSEVRVLYDHSALYVGFRAYDSHPDSIAAQLARRDAGGIYTDWVHVAIDSYHDRRTAWRFSLNPRGVQADGSIFNDTERDPLWDAVWDGAVHVDSLGWTAEFRIPLSQLRYRVGATGDAQVWGINFARELARRGERTYWSPTPPDAPGVVSRMGTLVGLDSLGAPSRLELVPYVRAQVTHAPGEASNPFYRRADGNGAVGLDLRYRLPKNLTLSATINPDFGQVEADPATVNLTAFETFFAERRPFFLEGQDVFRFGGTRTFNDDDRPNFFYTRRLGRAPQRRVSGSDVAYVDAPAQTPILAAAKVSGKTESGWSIGALGASTREQSARVSSLTGVRSKTPVEPLSGYGILRVRRDLHDGNTVIGGVATGVARDLTEPALAALLARRAMAGGVDFEHAWHDRTWTVSGVLSATQVTGDKAVITRLQRAAYRLYQRPDADYLGVDSARTSLGGRFSALSLAKTGGRHWLGSLTYEETTPGFETNDLGFQQRADRRTMSSALIYRSNRRGTTGIGRAFRSYQLSGFYTGALNFGGTTVASRPALGAEGTFANFWSAETQLSINAPAWSDRLTRGGPQVRMPSRWSVSGDVGTDSRRAVRAELSGFVERGGAGHAAHEIGIELDARPSAAVRLRAGPYWTHTASVDQYLGAVTDAAATTYGRRYTFANVNVDELSLELRADWTFTPRLSLQLYAAPFASRGAYVAFKDLTVPGSFGFTPSPIMTRANGALVLDPDGAGPRPALGIGEPDFVVRALRGNAVVRWEFRPGSALFVVWQQQRDHELDDAFGARGGALGSNLARAFGDRGTDVWLVKVSRYIGR